MTGGLSLLLRLAGRSEWHRFEAAADDPDSAHRELWARISRACEGSEFWGKRWGPSGAPALDDLPLTEYADYQPAFEAAFESKHSPTTGEPIIQWTETGGTSTNTPKRFPLTGGWDRQSHVAWMTFVHSLGRAAQLPLKPLLMLFSAGLLGSSPAGVPVGHMSGRLLSNVTGWKQRLTAIPHAVVSRPEFWAKYAPLYAVTRDVSLVLGLTAGWVARFHELLIEQMDSYWPLLEGREHPPAPLPRLSISRSRLQYLRTVFETGSPGFRTIWPGLGAIACWTTASAGASLPLLEKRRDGVHLLDCGFSSTESGLTTMPLYDGKEGHALHPRVNLVELLPEGAAPEPQNVIRASQAEPGCRYEMILTTLTGLVRYRMFDILECTGFYRRTPRLAFRSKSAFYATVGSVSISEDDAVSLMLKQGFTLRNDVMLGPHSSGQGFALYIKEGSAHAPTGEGFDRALCETWQYYGKSRRSGVVDAVQTIVTPASHPMWVRGTHAQAKDRYVLAQAPDDLTP